MVGLIAIVGLLALEARLVMFLFGGGLENALTGQLIAVMANWQVPGWAAFCAVAAFIAGFATLVVHMGERPPQDSGPDDGAVV